MTKSDNEPVGAEAAEPEADHTAEIARAFAAKYAENFTSPAKVSVSDATPPEPAAEPVAEPAPEAPEVEADDAGELDALADRLAGGNAPSPRDALRSRLVDAGMPEDLAKSLTSHGKKASIEAWLEAQSALGSTQEAASQPSAPADPAVSANEPAPQQSEASARLTGLRANLLDGGVLDESGAQDLETLGALLERAAALEARLDAVAQQREQADHQAAVAAMRSELDGARSALAGRFPQVADDGVFRDRVAPVLEALARGDASGSRTIAEQLELACKATLDGSGSAKEDARSQKLLSQHAERQTPQAPIARNGQPSTISERDFAAALVTQMMSGGAAEERADFVDRWTGRVK